MSPSPTRRANKGTDFSIISKETAKLRTAMEGGKAEQCQGVLEKLSIPLMELSLQTLKKGDKKMSAVFSDARDALEIAAVLAMEKQDFAAFERYILRLKPFYGDFEPMLSTSERKWELVGLYLIMLLSENRIADFHLELELIPVEKQSTKCISYVIAIEQDLMEGSYSRLWSAAAKAPIPSYKSFANVLIDTVRQRILDSFETVYSSLTVADAKELLHIENDKDVRDLLRERDWTIDEMGVIETHVGEDDKLDIPSHRVMRQTLMYASELERIV